MRHFKITHCGEQWVKIHSNTDWCCFSFSFEGSGSKTFEDSYLQAAVPTRTQLKVCFTRPAQLSSSSTYCWELDSDSEQTGGLWVFNVKNIFLTFLKVVTPSASFIAVADVRQTLCDKIWQRKLQWLSGLVVLTPSRPPLVLITTLVAA